MTDQLFNRVLKDAELDPIQHWDTRAVLEILDKNISWRASYLFTVGFEKDLKEIDLVPIVSEADPVKTEQEYYSVWLNLALWVKKNIVGFDIHRVSCTLYGDEGGPVVTIVLVRENTPEQKEVWEKGFEWQNENDWLQFWAGDMGLSKFKREDVRVIHTTAM